MGAVRIIVLAVAAVAAIGLALMVRHMASGQRPAPVAVTPPPVEKPMAQVLVARHDLAVGSRISAGDVGWQPWPLDSLNPSFITDGSAPSPAHLNTTGKAARAVKQAAASISGSGAAQALNGAVVREAILSGEPVTERKIVRGGEGGFMAVVLQPGMRAMSLPMTVESGAGGFILPGDRVDVLQNRHVEGGAGGSNQETVSKVIMRNLRVLAIDQTTAQSDKAANAKSLVGSTATLEVPAADEAVMSRAKSQGDLVLALRSYADAGGPSGRSPGGDNSRVKIWRGGVASEVTVAQ